MGGTLINFLSLDCCQMSLHIFLMILFQFKLIFIPMYIYICLYIYPIELKCWQYWLESNNWIRLIGKMKSFLLISFSFSMNILTSNDNITLFTYLVVSEHISLNWTVYFYFPNIVREKLVFKYSCYYEYIVLSSQNRE